MLTNCQVCKKDYDDFETADCPHCRRSLRNFLETNGTMPATKVRGVVSATDPNNGLGEVWLINVEGLDGFAGSEMVVKNPMGFVMRIGGKVLSEFNKMNHTWEIYASTPGR